MLAALAWAPVPALVAHADWSTGPAKRRLAVAKLSERYVARAPVPVGEPRTLLERLRQEAGGSLLVGFDFPIGLPARYARAAGVRDFRGLLRRLGRDEWAEFYKVATSPGEIGLRRPFYPLRPGGTRQRHLLDALGARSMDELRRVCERASDGLPPASPLFWTLGAKQVGKAAIQGWRDVLAPALRDPKLDVVVWPFDGPLDELLAPGRTVVAETYPPAYYRRLGIVFGRTESKRRRTERAARAGGVLRWADAAGISLTSRLRRELETGFESEDAFDAAVGLFGMLDVVLGRVPSGEPRCEPALAVEGWILGRPHIRSTH
jgi:hypothetical protein